MKKKICLILGLLILVYGTALAQVAKGQLLTQMAIKVSASGCLPQTGWIFRENFESPGACLSWATDFGTPNNAYTSAAIEGSDSCLLSAPGYSSFDQEHITFSAQTAMVVGVEFEVPEITSVTNGPLINLGTANNCIASIHEYYEGYFKVNLCIYDGTTQTCGSTVLAASTRYYAKLSWDASSHSATVYLCTPTTGSQACTAWGSEVSVSSIPSSLTSVSQVGIGGGSVGGAGGTLIVDQIWGKTSDFNY